MRLSARVGTTAVAVAVMTGICLMGGPAQAKTPPVVSGTAELEFAPSLVAGMSLNGVQISPLEPADWEGGDPNTWQIEFPVTKRTTGRVIPLDGDLAIGATLNRLDLTTARLELPAGVGPGQIAFATTGMPVDAPAELADGTRIALLQVFPIVVTAKKGRVKQSGEMWTRTDTQRITGEVRLTNDAAVVNSINSYIGTILFTPGREFGTLDAKVLTKVTCSTRAACR